MADYIATGAGTSAVDQDYGEGGMQDSKPKYQGDADNSYWIAYGSVLGGWVISTDPAAATAISSTGPHAYYIHSATVTPPSTGWLVGGAGTAPVPVVSAAIRATLPLTGAG